MMDTERPRARLCQPEPTGSLLITIGLCGAQMKSASEPAGKVYYVTTCDLHKSGSIDVGAFSALIEHPLPTQFVTDLPR